LKIARCTTAACTAVTATNLDVTASTVGGFTSIAVGLDGIPLVSYQDGTSLDLKIARCTTPACTAVATTAVDTTGFVGSFTSIALGADGLPVVSYNDATNNDLKVLACGNLACSPYVEVGR
jgi:hypothetical protein